MNKRRIGIFEISDDLYRTDENKPFLQAIFSKIIPWRITDEPSRQTRIVYAECDKFDEVNQGEAAPNYNVFVTIVFPVEDIIVSFERIV